MSAKWPLATAVLAVLPLSAHAADKAKASRVHPAATVASTIDWSGLYIGAGIVYLRNSGTGTTSGIGGTLTGGYNWQFGNAVAGIEAEAAFASADVGAGQPLPGLFDVRGRVGYGLGDVLFYGTGGGAVVPGSAGTPASGGLAAGAGVDWGATDNTFWGLQVPALPVQQFPQHRHPAQRQPVHRPRGLQVLSIKKTRRYSSPACSASRLRFWRGRGPTCWITSPAASEPSMPQSARLRPRV